MASTAATDSTGFFQQSVVPVVLEMMSTFPDGLILISGLFALLTLSMPYGVFFGSMVEASLLFRFFQSAASYLNIMKPSPNPNDYSNKCRTGFTLPKLDTLSAFGGTNLRSPFPSAPLYMMSVASAYLFGSLNYLSKELEALGPSYSSRYYVSLILLTMLIFIFIAFRILYGCDGPIVAMITVALGLILGTVLIQQNVRLFGDNSINLIGIPILRSRTAAGKKLYVCATRKE
jgi:hypothetical protein